MDEAVQRSGTTAAASATTHSRVGLAAADAESQYFQRRPELDVAGRDLDLVFELVLYFCTENSFSAQVRAIHPMPGGKSMLDFYKEKMMTEQQILVSFLINSVK